MIPAHTLDTNQLVSGRGTNLLVYVELPEDFRGI